MGRARLWPLVPPAPTWRLPQYADCVAGWLAAADRDLTREQLLDRGRWAGVFGPGASADLVAELTAIGADNGGADHPAAHPAAYEAMVRSMAEADLRDVLPTVGVSTLLLYGELDERSPLTVARALHRSISGSQLHVIAGAGHMTCAEAPDEFNAVVARWVLGL